MNDGRTDKGKIAHNITLSARERLSVSGIREIVSFDESGVSVRTLCGDLIIDGEGMHISVLNIEKGELELQGKINGISYADLGEGDRRTLLSRIFG